MQFTTRYQPLTPRSLRTVCREIWGKEDWKNGCVEFLGIDRTTLFRWLNGERPISMPVSQALHLLVQIKRMGA